MESNTNRDFASNSYAAFSSIPQQPAYLYEPRLLSATHGPIPESANNPQMLTSTDNYIPHRQFTSSSHEATTLDSLQPGPSTVMTQIREVPHHPHYPRHSHQTIYEVPSSIGGNGTSRAGLHSWGEHAEGSGNVSGLHTSSQPMTSHPWSSDDSSSFLAESRALNEERRRALAEVDNARFSRFHMKVVAIVGAGFFTDAYDTFVIDTVATILGFVYGQSDNTNTLPVLTPLQILGLKAAGPVGTFFGMIFFAYAGDRLGRKRAYGMELYIIITAVFVQAMLGQGGAVNIINSMIIWRLIMGVGIGGDYPTSAVIASEFAPIAFRGRMVTAVFATQGLGQFVGIIVSIILVYAYKPILDSAANSNPDAVQKALDQMWRILIGIGCVPGTLALFYRFTIPETPRFTMDIARNVNQASQDIDTFLTTGGFFVNPDARVEHVLAPIRSWDDWVQTFKTQRNFVTLVGTCFSWFALDIAFYGFSLNSSIFLASVFPIQPNTTNIWDRLHLAVTRNVIPLCTGLLPGYVAAYFIVDRYGRRPLQLVGFVMLFLLLLIMGILFNKFAPVDTDGHVTGNLAIPVLYCLTSFFLNAPNVSTFLVPCESYPTRYRSTMHGVAAASGKLGAIISQLVIYKLLRNQDSNRSIQVILIIFAVFMLAGVASTWIVPETKGTSLEDNSGEDQTNFIRGPAPAIVIERRRQV